MGMASVSLHLPFVLSPRDPQKPAKKQERKRDKTRAVYAEKLAEPREGPTSTATPKGPQDLSACRAPWCPGEKALKGQCRAEVRAEC